MFRRCFSMLLDSHQLLYQAGKGGPIKLGPDDKQAFPTVLPLGLLNIGLSNVDTFAWVGAIAAAPNTTKSPAEIVPDPSSRQETSSFCGWLAAARTA